MQLHESFLFLFMQWEWLSDEYRGGLLMNIASVVVICILAVLLILVVVCSRKNKEGECGGNCAECKLCKR